VKQKRNVPIKSSRSRRKRGWSRGIDRLLTDYRRLVESLAPRSRSIFYPTQ
jgi:hypothetical protein